MAPYPGLAIRHDGTFELIHPITKKHTGLATKDRALAIRAWQRFMPGWMAERNDVKAERLAAKLSNMDEIDQRGMSIMLTDYAKEYREKWLPNKKAKGKNGKPIEPRTLKDYESKIRIEIEASELLEFPLADKYADIKIKRFLHEKWGDRNRTYNYMRTILSIIFGHAVDSGILRKNPVLDIPPKEKTKRMVYLDDAAYSAITTAMMKHEYFGKDCEGEWRARICDLCLFSGCRPDDTTKIEDCWFDEKGVLTYRASKNKQLVELEDVTGALAETVLWLRQFKKAQGKISKYLCVYPRYMGLRMFRQERVSSINISRMFSENVIAAGYSKGAFIFRDIRKKSIADDPGQNKGGHSKAMQEYYESVKERAVKARNNLTNPRKG